MEQRTEAITAGPVCAGTREGKGLGGGLRGTFFELQDAPSLSCCASDRGESGSSPARRGSQRTSYLGSSARHPLNTLVGCKGNSDGRRHSRSLALAPLLARRKIPGRGSRRFSFSYSALLHLWAPPTLLAGFEKSRGWVQNKRWLGVRSIPRAGLSLAWQRQGSWAC